MHKSSQWNYYYSLLEKYYKEHGNIDIPSSFKIDGEKVGLWLEYQKQAYRGAFGYTITQERIERLEKLGINWGNNVNSWNRNYALLEEYYKEHGNIDVPQSYKVNGVNLGTWLNSQRHAYKVQDKNLTKDRIEKLEKLGIKWVIYIDVWDRNYKLLEEYYEKHGNIDVPNTYKVNGINLGRWLNTQRQTYKGKGAYKITPYKIEKLNKLDIDWFLRETTTLNKTIKDMEIYNRVLNKKLDYVLRDIKLEGMNMITSMEEQKEIEKIIVKRLFR